MMNMKTEVNLETVARLMPAINEKAIRQAADPAKLIAGYRHMFRDADAQRNVLADALTDILKECNSAMSETGKLVCIARRAADALRQARTLNHENA